MLYILSFIMIIINLFLRNKKMLYIIDFIFFVVLLGFSYGPYDTMIFISRYISYERYESFTEILFNQIVLFFNHLNFNYRMFMLTISIIELIMIFKFIRKHTNNSCFVIGLFIIYPMVIVFEQLRFFMAFTIVLTCAIDALIEKKKFYRIKATCFILFASLIHSSVVFYLIFVIADFIDIKKCVSISIIVTIVLLTLGISPALFTIIGNFIGEQKLEILVTLQASGDGRFGRTILSIAVIFEYIVCYFYAYKNQKSLMMNDEDIEFMKQILKFNIISITAIPLIWVFSPAFLRIANNLLILNFIAYSRMISYHKKGCISKEKFIIIILLVLYNLMLFVFAIHTKEAMELIVKPFFEENEIYKLFI